MRIVGSLYPRNIITTTRAGGTFATHWCIYYANYLSAIGPVHYSRQSGLLLAADAVQ